MGMDFLLEGAHSLRVVWPEELTDMSGKKTLFRGYSLFC